MAQIVHGRNSAFDLTPKEVMLENMHTFQEQAYMSKAMAQWLVQTMPEGEARSRDVRALRRSVHAVQLPFLHSPLPLRVAP